jgi:quinol monooxygenase YgiN
MSVKLLARVKAKAGMERELEASYREMIKLVRANEPGCEAYILHRTNNDPTVFVWLESYRDQAAFDLHRNADHLKAPRARNDSLVEDPPKI